MTYKQENQSYKEWKNSILEMKRKDEDGREEEEAEKTQSESPGVTSRFLLQTGSGTGLLGSTLKSADVPVRSSWRQSLVTDDPGLRPE